MSFAIIKEIYENDSASEQFESQLERELEKQTKFIIIEPTKLGDDIAIWIHYGNCLHKTGVLAGVGSLLMSSVMSPNSKCLFAPFTLACVGWISTAVYTLSLQSDPCIKYQVVTDRKRLGKLPPSAVQQLRTVDPVVLEKRNDTRRRILHGSVSLLTASFWGWTFYQMWHDY